MRIIGQLVCGPGEADRYLEETLEEFNRICDDVVVCLCNAGRKEREMVRSYDFRSYDDDREWGTHQYRIKTDLLRRIQLLKPDYILALDADETVPTLDRETIEKLAHDRRAMQLFVVNLWNDEKHYDPTLGFWNVRLYDTSAYPQPQFLRKAVHCGNAPPAFYGLPARESYVPHILLHKGLMDASDRARKVERYAQFDPHAIHKGREYYLALESKKGGTIYDEAAVLAKVQAFVAKL